MTALLFTFFACLMACSNESQKRYKSGGAGGSGVSSGQAETPASTGGGASTGQAGDTACDDGADTCELAPVPSADMTEFALAKITVDEGEIEFFMNDGGDALVAANVASNWRGFVAGKRVIIRLYDSSQKELGRSASICSDVAETRNFGAMTFTEIDETNVNDVKFFNAILVSCTAN